MSLRIISSAVIGSWSLQECNKHHNAASSNKTSCIYYIPLTGFKEFTFHATTHETVFIDGFGCCFSKQLLLLGIKLHVKLFHVIQSQSSITVQ